MQHYRSTTTDPSATHSVHSIELPPPSLAHHRNLHSTKMLRSSISRSTALRSSSGILRPATVQLQCCQKRRASAHAISNPTLANIEKRWEGMPPQEQADLWMALRDRMKVNWAELTLQEKKAGMLYYPSGASICHSIPHRV